jgi:hypothetical protein
VHRRRDSMVSCMSIGSGSYGYTAGKPKSQVIVRIYPCCKIHANCVQIFCSGILVSWNPIDGDSLVKA